ncbi:MAG: FtsL-like putative cell division protein [Bacteroidia bacterium]
MANKYREIPTTENEIEEQEIVVDETTTNSPPEKPSKPRKKGVLGKGLSAVFSGTFLTNDKTLKHIPFVSFLAFIAILYIANGYYADDKIREVNKISNQLKELRSEYISTKSDLMFASKQSEVAKAADKLGLKEPVVPPIKIKVDSTQLYKTGN